MVKAGLAASRAVPRIVHTRCQSHVGSQLCGYKEFEHRFELVLDKKSTNLVEPDTLGL
jgi:hypothetical protein